jgi:hypothetical protein
MTEIDFSDVALSDEDMDDIGADIGAVFNNRTCIVKVSPSPDGGIGLPNPEEWDDVATVPCRVTMPSPAQSLQGFPEISAANRYLFVPRGTDIIGGNHLYVVETDERFDVIDVVQQSFQFDLQCLCVKVGP